jgi:hypothetical protein
MRTSILFFLLFMSACTEQPPTDPSLDLPPPVVAPVRVATATAADAGTNAKPAEPYIPKAIPVTSTGDAIKDAIVKMQPGHAFAFQYERDPKEAMPGLSAKGVTNGEAMELRQRFAGNSSELHYIAVLDSTYEIYASGVSNIAPSGSEVWNRIKAGLKSVQDLREVAAKSTDLLGTKPVAKFMVKNPAGVTLAYWIDPQNAELLKLQMQSAEQGLETVSFSNIGVMVALPPLPHRRGAFPGR